MRLSEPSGIARLGHTGVHAPVTSVFAPSITRVTSVYSHALFITQSTTPAFLICLFSTEKTYGVGELRNKVMYGYPAWQYSQELIVATTVVIPTLSTAPYLLLANSQYILQMNLDGSDTETLLSFSYCHALDFDYRWANYESYVCTLAIMQSLLCVYRRNYVFWTDDSNNRIMRAKLNDSQTVTVVNTLLCTPCKCMDKM